MPKKIVSIPYIARCNVTIDTDETDPDAIIEAAMEFSGFDAYVGNGGSGDRLVGTSEGNVTVEVCDEPYEDDAVKIEIHDA